MNHKHNMKNALSVFVAFFGLGVAGIIGYALGSGVFHGSFVGNPTYTYSYAVEISEDTISSADLLPGGTVSITPIITSKSTGNSYVFLRIECQSVDILVNEIQCHISRQCQSLRMIDMRYLNI